MCEGSFSSSARRGVALQVPLRLADFAAREMDFVAKCQPVGQFLPCSSLFGDSSRSHLRASAFRPNRSGPHMMRNLAVSAQPSVAGSPRRRASSTASRLRASCSWRRASTGPPQYQPAAHANRASTLARSRLSSASPPSASSSSVDRRLRALVIWLPDEPPAVPERGPGEPVGPARLASDVGRPDEAPLRRNSCRQPSSAHHREPAVARSGFPRRRRVAVRGHAERS